MTPVVESVATRLVESPLGMLCVSAKRHGLVAIEIGASSPPASNQSSSICEPSEVDEIGGLLDVAEQQLGEYFAGHRRGFDLPVVMSGTDFQRQAWAALDTIAYGETISYAEQARRMGRPGAARAVGSANGRNPIPIVVPCHRVIGADGSLTGYTGGVWIKRFLLDHERAMCAGGSGSTAVAT